MLFDFLIQVYRTEPRQSTHENNVNTDGGKKYA